MQRHKDISMILQLHFSIIKFFNVLFLCKLVNILVISKYYEFKLSKTLIY